MLLPLFRCTCTAINNLINVQYDGRFLLDIMLLARCYYHHRGTRLNPMKRASSLQSMFPPRRFDIFFPPSLGGCSEGSIGVHIFLQCVSVVCCHLIYSERQVYGRTNRGHTGGRSHGISPLSSCGACLKFFLEKDSAVPFPRRP